MQFYPYMKNDLPPSATMYSRIRHLRAFTGRGIGECRQALVETQGDIEAAQQWLRSRGAPVATPRPASGCGRIASYIPPNGRTGILIEVLCETDFAANTPEFGNLVQNLLGLVAQGEPWPTSPKLKLLADEASLLLKEPIRLGRAATLGLDGPWWSDPPGTAGS